MNSPSPLFSYGEMERYRLLIDAITDYAVYMLDRDGNIVSWNPGASRFKGYSAEEVIGRHFSAFYTEEDRQTDLPRRALNRAATEGRYEAEGWRVRKDGSRFWVNVVIDPIRSETGEVIGFAKVTRDLTERKRTEEALRRSEEMFRLLVQSVVDYAIFMIDREGFVTTWNAGAERIKGYAADEIIGQHFSIFYPEEDRKALAPQRALSTALRDGRFEKEGIRVRKDGSHFWANVVIDPVRNEAGELIGFTKVTRDVTERREAQQALEKTREALFQSQKLEAIGQLTGGVAHDFNNLLMVVISSLELIGKRTGEDGEVSRLVENARHAAERGSMLTQRMLSFARRQELRTQAVNVRELLEGMRELLESSVGSRVDIEVRARLSCPPVLTDPNQLETAILNVVLNAKDAMPDGGVITISVGVEETRKTAKAASMVKIAIEDTGTGMDPATLAKATEPFFTTKGVGKGTGLGLSMVHGLAEQSGGRLHVSSNPGEGTTVELWLPVASPAAVGPAREQGGPGAPGAEQIQLPRLPKLRILAVDDDALVLMNTAMMLEDLGSEVLQANSGPKALELLASRDGEVDVLVTDQSMPGMTGVELISEVKKRWPDIRIVIASGYAELPQSDLPRLSKPFTQASLSDALQAVLEGSQLAKR